MEIEQIILKNFKSFTSTTVKIHKGINALAGPNGSGKSNICDAIRFVLGETSLKTLRAKHVKDLIHKSKTNASVKLILKDGKNIYTLERKINNKGKMKYLINDKIVRQRDIYEFKITHGLSNSGRAIIGQGEVQKIVSISAKERRKYLDDIAGISTYELKKDEAMRELNIVETRINEKNLILGEKSNYLDVLKNEMEKAKEYKNKKQRLEDIKYTLLLRALKKIKSKIEKLNSEKEEKTDELKKLNEEKNKIDEEIEELMKEREHISNEITQKTKKNKLFQEIEKLKSDIKINEEKLNMKQTQVQELQEMYLDIKNQIETLQNNIIKFNEEIKNAKSKAEKIKIEKINKEDNKLLELNQRIEILKNEKDRIEKEIIRDEGEIKRLNMLMNELNERLKLINEEAEIENVDEKIDEIKNKIRESFVEEKTLNNELMNVEKEIIKIKEKMAVLRASVRNESNPIYYFIDELKKSGKVEGIYGKVIDLISFDEDLTEAIEGAAGGRLNYVVVENLNVAKTLINILRTNKVGRMTFIPLKELNIRLINKSPQGLGFLKDMVKIESGLEKVLEYLFGNTILINSFQEAKQYIGKYRTVTLKGELFEESGVVRGGKSSNILAKKMLSNLELKLEEKMNVKNTILSQLRDMRESLSKLRKELTRYETIKEKNEKEMKKIEQKRNEKKNIEKDIQNIKHKLELIQLDSKKHKLEQLNKQLKQKIEEREHFLKKYKIKLEEQEKNITQNISIKAMLIEKAKNYGEKLKESKEELNNYLKKAKEIESKISDLNKEIRQLRDDINIKDSELRFKEESFKQTSAKLDELMVKIEEKEKRLQKLGATNKKLTERIMKLNRELNKIDVELASLNVKEEELSNNLNKINGNELSEFTSNLEKEMEELEQELNKDENINFAAEEMYYKLYDEIGELKEKIDKLKEEKNSIIQLISEIETKKKDALLTTLEELNKHMLKISKNISNFGSAQLYLDNMDDPLNAGLNIKLIRKDGKEENILSLSGGEKTLLALIFLFAMQFTKPSPFYILDEVDAALDIKNSERLPELIKGISKNYNTQFILVSHNERVLKKVDYIIGVSKQGNTSKILYVKV